MHFVRQKIVDKKLRIEVGTVASVAELPRGTDDPAILVEQLLRLPKDWDADPDEITTVFVATVENAFAKGVPQAQTARRLIERLKRFAKWLDEEKGRQDDASSLEYLDGTAQRARYVARELGFRYPAATTEEGTAEPRTLRFDDAVNARARSAHVIGLACIVILLSLCVLVVVLRLLLR